MAPRKKTQAQPGWSPPKQFDEYRLLWQLGRGGMGEVYLGHDTLLDRPVAIKFISAIDPDVEMRGQFLTEARAAGRLQHPNVVAVYRVGEIDNRPYIISEFVRGQNLDHIKLPMPWARALELGIGLARGLAAAHRRGVLHRDIKPGNVILPPDGEVKLLDFGLAKFIENTQAADVLTEERQIARLDVTAPTLDVKAAVHAAEAAIAANKKKQLATTQDEEEKDKADEGESEEDVESAETPKRVNVHFQALLQGPTPAKKRGPRVPISLVDSGKKDADASEQQRLPDGGFGGLSTSSGIKGTPLYMAPEVLNGEPASRRSDIYSMGALLYELCVGSPPHYDPLASLEDLRTAVNTKDATLLATLVPNIEPRFAAVVARCLRRKPNERFSSGEELRDALEQIADSSKKDELPAGNPYRGLLPFEAEHRSLFFGRKSEIGTLVDRLRTEAFILVAADSGVGKSSLCRAGVLPLIAEGALGGNRAWKQVTLVPGRKPLLSLVSALAFALNCDEEKLLGELRADPSSLARELHRQLGDGRGLVIFMDQMEELVTIGDHEESAMVGEALASLITRTASVRLLCTVRSDFLARLASVPGIGDEISRALYILRPLSPEKIREVIIGPAHKKSVSFESDSLITHIVESTANMDGGLPLLQFALAELWEVKTGDVITAHALESIGGVTGALARHADHVIGRLPEEQRLSARRILMSLVTLEGTRARRNEEELVRDGNPARGALEALVRGRLLVARDTPEGAAYEVAHEALIKGWDTLRKWLEEHGESRAVKQRLETATADWIRLSRNKDVLWGARQIAETRLIEAVDIGPREAEFLSASRSSAARKRRIRQIILAAAPFVLVALFATIRITSARDLERRVLMQLTKGHELFTQSEAKNKEADSLRQQALAKFDAMQRDEGETIWAQALQLSRETDDLQAKAAQALEAAFSLDNTRKDVRAMFADVLYARALGMDRDRDSHLKETLERMALYDDDGSRQRRFNTPGKMRLESDPQGAAVTLGTYVLNAKGKYSLTDVHSIGNTPISEISLPPGSYQLSLRLQGRFPVNYPFIVGRGEALDLKVPLPDQRQIPPGFVYIPPGRFLFGASGDEGLRLNFIMTAPCHPIQTEGYLIAIYETTYSDYIAFLDSLPPEKRKDALPKVGNTGMTGMVELKETTPKIWELTFQPGSIAETLATNVPYIYAKRSEQKQQIWLRLPVGGVSRANAESYVDWLNQSGRVPGARLCTEHEWERAARGADDRLYPMGNSIEPKDANTAETYGKKLENFGPDEIGSHPQSVSPFGVHDMAGNVWELVASSIAKDETVGRGGSYSFDALTNRSVNRSSIDSSFREADMGIRVCASIRIPPNN